MVYSVFLSIVIFFAHDGAITADGQLVLQW